MTKEEAINIIRDIPLGNVINFCDEIDFVKQDIDNYLIKRAIKFEEVYDSPFEVLTNEDFIALLMENGINIRYANGKYYTCGKNVFAKGELIKMG